MPGFRLMLRRSIRRRCPFCGTGRIFATALHLRPSCPDCGHDLDREPGAVTGSMYLVSILTMCFAVFLLILILVFTDWTPVTSLIVAMPLILLFSCVALPFSRSVWLAIDCYTDQLAEGPQTKAREPGEQAR